MSPTRLRSSAAIAEAAARQPIDILIANAGAAESAPFGRSDAALFQRMMDVNFMGVVHATQAVLPAMIERRRGRIVAVASTAGLKGYAYVSAYSAAKHAVIGLVRSLALETAKSGITVNAVCPGFTETDLLEGTSTTSSRRPAAAASRRSPNCRNTIRKDASWRRRKSPTPCSGCAAKAPAPSPGRRSRSPAARSEACAKV